MDVPVPSLGDRSHRSAQPRAKLVTVLTLALAVVLASSPSKAAATEGFTALTSPTIVGTAMEARTLEIGELATWSAEPDTVRYRWYRCTTEGEAGVGSIPSGCTALARATSTSYTIPISAIGSYLRLLVTAASGAAIASTFSATSTAVVALEFTYNAGENGEFWVESLEPEARIRAFVPGFWSPAPTTVILKWYQCSEPYINLTLDPGLSVPDSCNLSPSRTTWSVPGWFYETSIGPLDGGYYLGASITASYGTAQSTVFLGTTDLIPIQELGPPSILSARWLQIGGDAVYNPENNGYAVAAVSSNPDDETNTIVYESFPRINGASVGWYRCNGEGGPTQAVTDCVLVRSRTRTYTSLDWGFGDLYEFQESDIGKYIRARIQIDNSEGSDFLFTATTEQITGPEITAPSIQADPGITEPPWEGQRVLRSWGSYALGYPLATEAYSWYACTIEGAAVDVVPEDCQLRIRSANYTPIGADVGKFLRIRIDLSNEAGEVSRVSATSEVVQTEVGPPSPRNFPELCYESIDGYGGAIGRVAFATGFSHTCGSALAGMLHFGRNGNWHSSSRILAQSFGWWMCSSPQRRGFDKGDCRLISTRTGSGWSGYIARASDIGRYLRLSTTALNRYGKTTVFSKTYLIREKSVYQPPRLLFFPEILDEPIVGQPLWEDGGAWVAYGEESGYYARVQSYRILWLACTTEGGAVREIPTDCTGINELSVSGGEVPASEYVPRPSDVGYYLRVAITANSVGGPSTAVSATTEIVGEPDAVVPTPLEDPAVFLEEIGGTRYFTSQIEWDGYPLPATSIVRWYRCTGGPGGVSESIPDTCAVITGANTFDYDVVAEDVGKRLRVAFTASTSSGTTTIASATTDPVPALPTALPSVTSPPLVSGLAMVSLRLIGTTGSWSALPANMTYTYRWYACSSSGEASGELPAGCAALEAYGLGYVPLAADRTKHLRLAVRATNSAGSTTHWSATTAAVAALSMRVPVSSGPPCIDSSDSNLVFGAVLVKGSCSVLWSAYPAVVGTSSSWWSCEASDTDRTGNSAPSGCRRVQSNHPRGDDEYRTTMSDLGRHLRLAMTATNRAGKATVWSATVGPIVEAPPETRTKPIIIFAPELYDTPEVGEWFWQDGGAWVEYGDADYPPIYGYSAEWLRCTTEGTDSDSLPIGCVAATGQTADADGPRSAYLPTTSDVGWYLRVAVTARNAAGSTTWYSGTSPIVPEPPRYAPQLISEPYFESGLDAGEVYAGTGNWSAYPPISPIQYRWHRCTGEAGGSTFEAPLGCSPIGSAAVGSRWYETVAADTGMRIRVEMIATNSEGQVSWFSPTSPIVPNLLPSNPGGAGAPAVSATVGDARSLSAWGGSWTGYGTPELTYAWYACTEGGSDTPTEVPRNCSAISGATSTTLIPQNLGGKYIRVMVTGTNSRGSSKRVSTAYGPLVVAPVPTVNPTITGSARTGWTLTANPGTWNGAPTFVYQWFRCTRVGRDNPATAPTGCTAITGAINSTYVPVSTDVSRFIRVRITASNISGTRTIFSQSTSAVTR